MADSTAEVYRQLERPEALRPALLPSPLFARAFPAPVLNEVAAARMKECFAGGEYLDCLQTARRILTESPDDGSALSYVRSCECLLERRYVERIGDLTAVPCVAVTAEQLRFLALDHREGFLLSRVDGRTTVDELCDIAGMDRLETLKTLAGLIESEVLRLR